MDWGGPEFILVIVAMAMIAGIVKSWIRASHGLPLSKRDRRHQQRLLESGGGDLDDARKVVLLTGENERLTGQVARLEDRLAVLERIVTDPAERTAREIDALR